MQDIEDRIKELKARIAASRVPNLWDQYALERLEKHAAGDTEPQPSFTQFSPPEVVGVSGWWNFVPEFIGQPKPWMTRAKPWDGIDLSVDRSNGCFKIKKLEDTVADWGGNPRAAQDEHGGSARLYKLAAALLEGSRYLFPTSVLEGGLIRFGDYALHPEVPFNAAEDEAFRKAFLGTHSTSFGLFTIQSKWLTIGTGFPKHYAMIVGNRPDLIVPAAMEFFNTGWFREKAYRQAMVLAHRIDNGQEAPVPGYTPPSQWGGSDPGSGLYRKWVDEFENSRAGKLPGLWTLDSEGYARK